MIPALPKYQLMGQWRELCSIARNIEENGTPGQILVNRIMDYPITHLCIYANMVSSEMIRRGYEVNVVKFYKHIKSEDIQDIKLLDEGELFKCWHNMRYFLQCFFNLEEKRDCGGISDEEWDIVTSLFDKEMLRDLEV